LRSIESVTTPPLAFITFDNDINWKVEPDKLVIIENHDGGFPDKFDVFELASNYVVKLPHVPYKNTGINFQLSLPISDPDQWLLSRFIKEDSWTKDVNTKSSSIKFGIETGFNKLNLSLKPGKAKYGKDEFVAAVIIDLNFHYEAPMEVNQIAEALKNWPACAEYAKGEIPKFLDCTD